MDHKRRAELAQMMISNPLWEIMKDELKIHYYNHFRLALNITDRERIATAHDIFDDVINYMESQAQMGEMINFPKTGDGKGAH
jgi:hypothetical protein